MSPRICYVEKSFRDETEALIAQANTIISEYREAGFVLTVRQLYYQFVARGHIENSQRSYKRLGKIVNDGRLAGRIDWEAIEDRTRSLRSQSHWEDPSDVVHSAANGYHKDLWATQAARVEVWIEKDALVGVIEGVCERWDVPYFSCRGYVSQSELWAAAGRHIRLGKPVTVLHLGDHDPSGIDMTRDIGDRLNMFGAGTTVRRIALNMDQVEEHSPPPNPAKLTDTRCAGYVAQYGDESWELDALDPPTLDALIDRHIQSLVRLRLWEQERDEMEGERAQLQDAANRWDDVEEFLGEDHGG